MPVCWSLSVGAQCEHGNEEECVAQLVLPAGQEDACKDFMDCWEGSRAGSPDGGGSCTRCWSQSTALNHGAAAQG